MSVAQNKFLTLSTVCSEEVKKLLAQFIIHVLPDSCCERTIMVTTAQEHGYFHGYCSPNKTERSIGKPACCSLTYLVFALGKLTVNSEYVKFGRRVVDEVDDITV
jgi:hypothetical protein